MRRFAKRILLFVVVGLILIQVVPVDRSNPPVTGEISAPDPVMAVLRSSCYDCHSNDTRWPWYSRVAPVSLRISRHVREAREHLNFSEWEGLPMEDRDHAMEEIWEKVEKGAMPLPDYLRMHPEAALTDPQWETLRRWTEGRDPEFPDWDYAPGSSSQIFFKSSNSGFSFTFSPSVVRPILKETCPAGVSRTSSSRVSLNRSQVE